MQTMLIHLQARMTKYSLRLKDRYPLLEKTSGE